MPYKKIPEAAGGVTVHANLTGLSADDHTQYPLLNGRATGQSIIGGVASAEDLSLESTSNASKGSVVAKDDLIADKKILATGQVTGNGTNGLLDLRGAQGGSVGGGVSLQGGFGLSTPGAVSITGGSTNSIGANVSIKGGDGPTGQSGAVIISGGTSGDDDGLGGDILLQAGQGGVVTGKGGDITISAGDSEGSGQAPGAINIKGGERIGFSERGDLVLQDTGGNVGIGTASPDAQLDVTGDVKISDDFTVDGDLIFADKSNGTVTLGKSTTGTDRFNVFGPGSGFNQGIASFYNSGNGIKFRFRDQTTTGSIPPKLETESSFGMAFNTTTNSKYIWYINGTGNERMRLEPSGLTATSLNVSALNSAPASAGATGTTGEVRYTSDHIYVCVATDTWKRTAISTWV